MTSEMDRYGLWVNAAFPQGCVAAAEDSNATARDVELCHRGELNLLENR